MQRKEGQMVSNSSRCWSYNRWRCLSSPLPWRRTQQKTQQLLLSHSKFLQAQYFKQKHLFWHFLMFLNEKGKVGQKSLETICKPHLLHLDQKKTGSEAVMEGGRVWTQINFISLKKGKWCVFTSILLPTECN